MSNLSELLPSGGGQNQIDFVASGTLPNGKPVVLKSNGQVEVIVETASQIEGSEVVYESAGVSYQSLSFDPNNVNKFVIVYRDGGNSGYGTAIAGQVSGSNLSFGTEVVFNAATTSTPIIKFKPSVAYEFVVAYADLTSSTGKINVGTVSNTSITFDSATTFNNAGSEEVGMSMVPSSSGKFVVCYADSGNNTYGTAAVWQIGSTNLTSTNLIGISAEAASSGATVKINTWGGINESQTSLTIGSDYYAQTNGTITTATGGQKLGTAISATTINIRDLP